MVVLKLKIKSKSLKQSEKLSTVELKALTFFCKADFFFKKSDIKLFIKEDYTLHSFYVYSLLFILSMLSLLLDYPQSLS